MHDVSNYQATVEWAQARDAADPLRSFRDEFLIPPHNKRRDRDTSAVTRWACRHAACASLNAELDDWADSASKAISTADSRGCPTTRTCASISPPGRRSHPKWSR